MWSSNHSTVNVDKRMSDCFLHLLFFNIHFLWVSLELVFISPYLTGGSDIYVFHSMLYNHRHRGGWVTSLHALEPPQTPEDLARSAADAPRMGGLALVKSGDEVLRQGPHNGGGREGGEVGRTGPVKWWETQKLLPFFFGGGVGWKMDGNETWCLKNLWSKSKLMDLFFWGGEKQQYKYVCMVYFWTCLQ